MPRPEFEEKEYEIQMAIELPHPSPGRRYLQPAGQALEHLLGYDVAADPQRTDPIWHALRTPRPAGVRLLPPHFGSHADDMPPSSRLPPRPISLMLQYKRASKLTRRTRTSPPAGARLPIFRVEIETHQQGVLRRLESNVQGSALVRYAAPAFHTVGELEQARLRGDTVNCSNYVAPSVLGTHGYWYFDRAGTQGWANPEPVQISLQDAKALFSSVDEASDRPSDFTTDGTSLHGLAEAIRDADSTVELLVDRWIGDIEAQSFDLDNAMVERLRDLASISTFAESQRLDWYRVGAIVESESAADAPPPELRRS